MYEPICFKDTLLYNDFGVEKYPSKAEYWINKTNFMSLVGHKSWLQRYSIFPGLCLLA